MKTKNDNAFRKQSKTSDRKRKSGIEATRGRETDILTYTLTYAGKRQRQRNDKDDGRQLRRGLETDTLHHNS